MLVFRYRAVEFAEVSRAGGDDDDPVKSPVRRRATLANVEFGHVGQRSGLVALRALGLRPRLDPTD